MDLQLFAKTFLRFRPLIAFLVIGISVAAIVGVSRIRFDDNPRGILRKDNEDFELLVEMFDQFGADENECYLIVYSEHLFSPQSIDDLRKLHAAIEKINGVEAAFSITDARLGLFPIDGNTSEKEYEKSKQSALSHPIVSGRFVSEDGKRTLITVRLVGEELSISLIKPVTDQLRELADQWTEETSLQVEVTGIPPIRADAFNLIQSQSILYTILGAIGGLLMAIFLLRRFAMVLIVCTSAFVGALWTVGVLGLVGEKITVLTTVLPMLVMIVGFTDAVHMIFDIAHSRAHGSSPVQATEHALRHITIPCFLTSVTTAIGFGSLCLTEIELIRRFGFSCAVGSGLTFICVITVLPLLASTWLGKGILPPPGVKSIKEGTYSIGSRLIDGVLHFRIPITLIGIGLAIFLTFNVLQLRPESEVAENLPETARSIVALRKVDKHFGGILPAFVCIDWPEGEELSSQKLEEVYQRVHKICEQHEAVNHPFSLLNVMETFPFVPPERFPEKLILVRKDKHRGVVAVRSRDRGSAYLSTAFEDLETKLSVLEKEFPGYQFRLTGSTVFATQILEQMIISLARSLGLATAIIFITMAITYRSIRIGLICLLPNALPLLVTAYMLLVFDGTLRFAGVIVFSVCLGIAVDDTIHLVTRFQRELKLNGDVEMALRKSVLAVGPALITTTLVLVVGLAIPITSVVPANQMFSWLSCVAITSALLSDLIFLPAMLACFLPSKK